MKPNENRIFIITVIATLLYSTNCTNTPYPIQFSISEIKIVDKIPQKNQDFAYIIPGQNKTYIFDDESKYYKDYQQSYFAITTKKAGWDCLRHYEILANGCIPYFLDLENCPKNTMVFLPKELILEAMNLEGVSYGKIDHSKFNYKKYYEILSKLLDHTRKYLTTRSIAQYILNTVGYSGKGKILVLSDVNERTDYMVACTVIGLKELIGDRVIDYPKIEYIYKNYQGNTKLLYGKGFTYTKIVDDYLIDRENIAQRIKNKEFELIIYTAIHYYKNYHWNYYPDIHHLFYDEVINNYPQEKIIYLDGEDYHEVCIFLNLQNFFLREYDIHLKKL